MFLQAVLALVCVVSASAMTPPMWPPVYSISFLEEGHMTGNTTLIFQNNGTWYYDFSHMVARFDKSQGQKDIFCSQQAKNLSPNNPEAPCQILFSHSGNLYVIFPNVKTCCTPCGNEEHCTIVKPNWLESATYVGNKTLEMNTCYGWEVDGNQKNIWYVTKDNIPCQLVVAPKTGKGLIHTMTFYQKSYKLSVPSSVIFNLPGYCLDKCKM